MNIKILRLINDGRLILFLGAGASCSSKDKHGQNLLSGSELSKLLAEEAGFSYEDEPLDVVYSAAIESMGSNRVARILEDRYLNTSPSSDYEILARYPWARVYTTNIDDAFEIALQRESPQNIIVYQKDDPIEDQDQTYNTLHLIKLNGSADRASEGFIFSPQEYGAASSTIPTWYGELAQDYFRTPFLFIGTKLKEPLFFHQIERYKHRSASVGPLSYVLTPSITDLERTHFSAIKLEHVPAKSSDFAKYLQSEIPTPPKPIDLAMTRRPELKILYGMINQKEREKYISTLNSVIVVTRKALEKTSRVRAKIRDFYKGFKPDWKDILDEVPAYISITNSFVCLFDNLADTKHLVVVYGAAGSGKTTLLMQTAFLLNERDGINTYFLSEPVNNLRDVVQALDKANAGKYLLFSDSLSLLADQAHEILSSGCTNKCIFVFSERQHLWESQVRSKLEGYVGKIFEIPLISKGDADPILKKIKLFGPWTKLANKKKSARIDELVQRSKRQLLIGLLEITRGIGFEKIIENDFKCINERSLKFFVLIVGLSTYHRRPMPITLLGRALECLSINENPYSLLNKLSGIAHRTNNVLWVRHPVYISYLYESIIDSSDSVNAIIALLVAFSAYKAPVIRSTSRSEGAIFKSIINHKFLRKVLHNDKDKIISVYQNFETIFSIDGLFWLQYGLALRDFGMQDEAYEKLRTAFDAYPMVHTVHALAHQMLILAHNMSNENTAMRYFEEAKGMLNRLDEAIQSDDTYPIITLSEGHVLIVSRFSGLSESQKLAQRYLDEIKARFKNKILPSRVKETEDRLFRYIVSGEWFGSQDWPE